MKRGQLVMLVGTDGYMPPMGAVGEIVVEFDGEDYGVMFPAHPCPVQSQEWYVPPHMLMPIDGVEKIESECRHDVTLTRIGDVHARCMACGALIAASGQLGGQAGAMIAGGAPEDSW